MTSSICGSNEELAIERLKALHAEQGYIVFGSRVSLDCGAIVQTIAGFDPMERHTHPFQVIGNATRAEFLAQYVRCAGGPYLDANQWAYYYRVRAPD